MVGPVSISSFRGDKLKPIGKLTNLLAWINLSFIWIQALANGMYF